jgi:competence protein ComEC
VSPPHDARLVPAALAAYGAALAVVAGAPWWILVALAMGLASGAYVMRTRALGGALGLAALIAVIVAVVAIGHDNARWSGNVRDAVDSGPVRVTGEVVREPQPVNSVSRDGEARVSVAVLMTGWAPPCDCDGTGSPSRWHGVRAPMTVVAGSEWASLEHGATFVAQGELAPARLGKDVATGWDLALLERWPAAGLPGAIAQLRNGFRDASDHLPDPVRGLTRGMVMGDTAAMPTEQVRDMRVASLAHLTAVSGAHFAIVLMATAGLMRVWKWPRRVRAVAAAVVMAGFATLVFPEPSVMRALTMALTVCVALWWGRPAHALPALAAAVVTLLLVDPFLALSFGFVLSVTAVAAIVLWAPVLARSFQRIMTPALAHAIAIPAAAHVACAPILVLLNPGVSLYGVPANLVAALCAVPVTLIGLVSLAVAPLSLGVAAGIASVASIAAWPIAWVSHTVAQAPGTWVTWPEGWRGAVLLALVSASVMLATSLSRVSAWWRVAGVVAVLTAVVSVGTVREATGLGSRPLADWQVVTCDVGQGHMMMVRAGQNAAIVIDVGGAGLGGVQCAARYGVTEIPLLVLTHPHSDHDGAVGEMVGQARVGRAWVAATGHEPQTDQAVATLTKAGVPVETPGAGTLATVGDVSVEVLLAGDHIRGSKGEHLNDSSVVVRAVVGDITVVNLGDLEVAGQEELRRRTRGALTADVLMAAHHGSGVQHPPLIEAIRAAVVVVGVGAGNSHGHPAASALDLYGARGAPVLRTDECGDIAIAMRESLVVDAGCPLLVGK